MKDCKDCNLCCKGYLKGEAYGNIFEYPLQCAYLIEEKCTIYSYRPDVCRSFYCGWVQGLFSDALHPLKSCVIISVEQKEGKQYLRLIPTNSTINNDVIAEIEEFCTKNNTFYI